MSAITAKAKKKESIAEYIIYMYQTEDLILNYEFNLDQIFDYVIKHMSRDERVRKELLLWYADIIEQMKTEGIVNSKKRLSSTQEYIEELTILHEKYLVTDKFYRDVYAKAATDVQNHIVLSENTINNPVQICLNGIYGMLLLKLNGKTISVKQQEKLAKFGSLLGYLSEVYKKESPPSK